MSKVALLVELHAKPGKGDEVAAFLTGAQPLAAAEPETLTWFALRIDAETFVVFDAFADEHGREAHLGGPIAAALMAHADELLAQPPMIRRPDVLADTLPV
jgi:quinol monooxygenase YgiN